MGLDELLRLLAIESRARSSNRIPRVWRARQLAERYGTPLHTMQRYRIPELVAAGVLVKRGRYWYGRAIDLDDWFTGRKRNG